MSQLLGFLATAYGVFAGAGRAPASAADAHAARLMRRLSPLLRGVRRRLRNLAAVRAQRRQHPLDRRGLGRTALRRPDARRRTLTPRLTPSPCKLGELRPVLTRAARRVPSRPPARRCAIELVESCPSGRRGGAFCRRGRGSRRTDRRCARHESWNPPMCMDLWLCEPRSGSGRRRNECWSRPPGAPLTDLEARSCRHPVSAGRAVGLSSTFPLVFAASVVPRGAAFGIAFGVSGGVAAVVAIIRDQERALTVFAALLPAAIAVALVLAEWITEPVSALQSRRAGRHHPRIDLLPALSSRRVSRSETRPSSGARSQAGRLASRF